ncbi:MAG: preprotein translocase subunit SecE [Oscillospiraceae bacterium]|nr:preprotein translocase subunit SecE [Oscillospiraceae bacterium]
MAEEQKKAGAPSQKKQAVKKGAPAQVTTEAVKKGEELTRIGKIKKWFREMKAELKKVVWPSKNTVIKNTAVALGVMAVAAVCIWGFDQIAQLGVKALINLVG